MKTQMPNTVLFGFHEEAIVGQAPCLIIHLLPEGKLMSVGVSVSFWLERRYLTMIYKSLLS